MASQQTLQFRTPGRSTLDITAEVRRVVRAAGVGVGLVNVFVQHTSCSLTVTENADASVRHDLETLARRWAPDGDAAYRHDDEGEDDMAAHARSVLTGCSVSIPVSAGELLLGTWQGIYLFEHRAQEHRREVIVTLLG